MTTFAQVENLAPWQFDAYVAAEVYGEATPEQLAVLERNAIEWRASLARMRHEIEESLASARTLPGDERAQVVNDLKDEQRLLTDAWRRLVPDDIPEEKPEPRSQRAERSERAERVVEDTESGEPALQASWEPGRVVVWGGGPGGVISDGDEVRAWLRATGANESDWAERAPVPMARSQSATAYEARVGQVLGWLVAAGAGQLGDDVGESVRWLGRVALWAVELTARGAMVPQLRRRARRGSGGRSASGSYSVRWTPALVDPARLAHMSETMPGSVTALDRRVDRRALTRSALTGMVDAICRKAASGIEVAAPPPHVRTATDVAEAFLGRLDGSAFEAPTRVADDIVGKIEQWARAVTSAQPRLIVQLDPPDESNAWHLAVLAPGSNNKPVPVERAIVMAGGNGPQIESELTRLERMVPALARLGGHRRGEVIVGGDEAWELMATLGPRLSAAGFDVRVPEMSKKRATPMLRLYSESKETSVGANQLADVRWSALFDDIELTAADIARLAREARPLIHSGGRWVAIERADLQAAAEALAERENKTKMTGAEMLRLSLGLGDVPLAGVSIAGSGWAADLLAAVKQVSSEVADAPEGFVGALRSYQSEALAWLQFLDDAGLGGCLALDMGLGKTPTMLAHLLEGAEDGPALVVAPPAVVGNWKAEADRFSPKLRVVVHHGANRASAKEIARQVKKADVILTTYGTAVRDIDALSKVEWSRVVLDEAQAIKNPASDTAQQLRGLKARSKVALTGTPIENGLGDLWAILDFTNPGLVGSRPEFIASMSKEHGSARVQAEDAMHALNGILVFRRTKSEPEIAAELPDQIDEIDHCAMTKEQIGLYQALINTLVASPDADGEEQRKGQVLAAITGLKQICNHPWNYDRDDKPLAGRSGKLARLEEIVDSVYAAGEKVLIFTHFAEWGIKLAGYLTERTGTPVACYHGGLARGARDRLVDEFQSADGAGALVLSLKAGGTGLNLTAANHVVLYDRWWNPAVEDQARDRSWRIGQTRTVICHRLICPGTVDERVEEVVAGKRHIADVVLPKSSSLADLDSAQLQRALGIRTDELLTDEDEPT